VSVLGKLSLVSGATFASRVLGLFRDILFFAVFATTLYGEAFLLAFTIPNLFRRMLGEGTLSSAFIPVFSGLVNKGKEEHAWSLLNQTLTRLFTYLGLLTLGVCFLSWVLFEFKFFDEAKWQLASLLNCSTFSYALLICGTSLLIASLNVKGRFLEGASSPLILNCVLIICLTVGIFCQITDLLYFAFLLGLAVLLAGVLQTLVPWLSLRRNTDWRWQLDYQFNESLREVKSLFWVGAIGAAVAQINILVSRFLAFSLDDAGGVSLLYLSARLVELPLGVFAIALSTVLFPELAKSTNLGNDSQYQKSFYLGLRLIFALTIPSAIGLFFLPELIIGVLFQWNNFGFAEVSKASEVLKVSAWTIPAYASSTFLVKALHSKKNMKAPFQAAMVSLIANICFSLFLIKDFGIIGLSLANLLAAFAQCAFLAFRCNFFRIRSLFDSQRVDVIRILVASLVLGAVLFFGRDLFNASTDKIEMVLQLACLMIFGILSYMVSLLALKFSWFADKRDS
jgi:putative peptidoglycan lipid II flippase